MQEITPEQSARLLSFAEQRDVLQAEVTALTATKDALQSQNQELTSSNATLANEISENERKLSEFVDRSLLDIEEIMRKKEQAVRELSAVLVEKTSAEQQLDFVLSVLEKINDKIVSIDTSAKDTLEHLSNVHGRVNGFITTIKEASEDIVTVSSNVKASIARFVDEIYTGTDKLISKIKQQDARELNLNEREAAINTLAEDYKKKRG